MGFVFQFFNLLPSLTAAENVEFALALTETQGGRAAQRRAAAPLESVGLIARALANRPRLLLCDEPTGNLHLETGRQVLEVLGRASVEEAAAVVVVTHNAALAPSAGAVLLLLRGLGPDHDVAGV